MNQHGFTKESLRKKFRLSEYLSQRIITGVAFLSITIIVLIFFFVFKETIPVFQQPDKGSAIDSEELVQEQYGVFAESEEEDDRPEVYGMELDSALMGSRDYGADASTAEDERVTVSDLLGDQWYPVSSNPRYGLIPLFVGTIKITIISILFAAPIAILAALFSAAFAPTWMREWVKPAIELLAGFPSVVIGFFALMVMATVLQELFGYETRLNAFVGGIAMGLAAIPIIFTITEDALTAIPGTYKEASLALGATKWQTALFVTLPAATPGIFAAILLGIGRVFGETMIALMATGNAALISANPFESVRTLAATIGAEMAEVVFGDTHYGVLFLIGSLLFVFTFTLNALAEFYVKGRLMKRIQGKIS
ncbi:MAG: phosphate ABC transporter permease subunit PstC [Bacteroidales bacterium]|nr:phosphate ABC transporter permease subunit PstC [Bacteroidales bacterium]